MGEVLNTKSHTHTQKHTHTQTDKHYSIVSRLSRAHQAYHTQAYKQIIHFLLVTHTHIHRQAPCRISWLASFVKLLVMNCLRCTEVFAKLKGTLLPLCKQEQEELCSKMEGLADDDVMQRHRVTQQLGVSAS